MRTSGKDRGAARLQTMTWLVVVLAIVGLCAYNVVSVISARVSTEDDAQDAAYAASNAWHATPSVDVAYQAAAASIAGKGETILTHQFSVDPDGTVHLVLRKPVRNIFMSHIGSLRKYTVAIEHGDANSNI
jgi:hypothetical protein